MFVKQWSFASMARKFSQFSESDKSLEHEFGSILRKMAQVLGQHNSPLG